MDGNTVKVKLTGGQKTKTRDEDEGERFPWPTIPGVMLLDLRFSKRGLSALIWIGH